MINIPFHLKACWWAQCLSLACTVFSYPASVNRIMCFRYINFVCYSSLFYLFAYTCTSSYHITCKSEWSLSSLSQVKLWAFLCKIIVHSFDLNVIASFMGNLDVLSIKCSIFLEILKLTQTEIVQVTTPLLFKLIPAVVHLGVLLRWFPPDSAAEVTYSFRNWND